MTTPTIPLPEPKLIGGMVNMGLHAHETDGYTAEQMLAHREEYAAARLAELEAEVSRLREALTELVAASDAEPGGRMHFLDMSPPSTPPVLP